MKKDCDQKRQVVASFDGQTIYSDGTVERAIPLDETIGQPGVPMQGGRIYIDQNPDMQPVKAVGYTVPGTYQALANDAIVSAEITRKVQRGRSTHWRLEERELPEWLKEDALAILSAALQWEFCRRLWRRVTTPGSKGQLLSEWVEDVIRTLPVYGFYLGEDIADKVETKFTTDGKTRPVWFPRMPEIREPWTVEYWITQCEELRAVVFNYSNVSDYHGTRGDSRRVIPAEKLVHITVDASKTNHTGRARLRSVPNEIDMIRSAMWTEAVAAEVNGCGEVYFILPEDTDDKWIDAISRHVDNRKSDQGGGGVLPTGTEIKTVSPSTTVPDLSSQISRNERRIRELMGSEDRAIGADGQTGSRAARETAADGQGIALDGDGQAWIQEPLEKWFVKWIKINGLHFGRDEYINPPVVEHGHVQTRDPMEYMDALKTYLNDVRPKMTEAQQKQMDQQLDLASAGSDVELER